MLWQVAASACDCAKLAAWRARYKAELDTLRAELRRAERSAAARQRAARPEARLRRYVFRQLRRMGFERETTSGRSGYYRHDTHDLTVRVSNHEVPWTPAREDARFAGRRGWMRLPQISHFSTDDMIPPFSLRAPCHRKSISRPGASQ